VAGEPEWDWLVSRISVGLTGGSFYVDPLAAGLAAPATYMPPALLALSPTLEYTTYVGAPSRGGASAAPAVADQKVADGLLEMDIFDVQTDQDDAFRLMRLTVSEGASGTIRLRTSYDNTLNAPGGAVFGEWVTYRFGPEPDPSLDADVPDGEPAAAPGPADEGAPADAGGSDPDGPSSPADAPEDAQPAPAPLPEPADDADPPVAEEPSEGPSGRESPADAPDGEPAADPGPTEERPAPEPGDIEISHPPWDPYTLPPKGIPEEPWLDPTWVVIFELVSRDGEAVASTCDLIGGTSLLPGNAAISPEPATLLLLAFGAIALIRRRK
jgi:hypothetical protein